MTSSRHDFRPSLVNSHPLALTEGAPEGAKYLPLFVPPHLRRLLRALLLGLMLGAPRQPAPIRKARALPLQPEYPPVLCRLTDTPLRVFRNCRSRNIARGSPSGGGGESRRLIGHRPRKQEEARAAVGVEVGGLEGSSRRRGRRLIG